MRPSRADTPCDESSTLSTVERERDISFYMRHSMVNTLGIKLLGVEIVTLLAIQVGASNLEIGYLAAVFQFSRLSPFEAFPVCWWSLGLGFSRTPSAP